jgi:SP family arabinose:H+ symporter-like MFS transporter
MSQKMGTKNYKVMLIALIVALGGLLMGFDASVISGVIGPIEKEFNLTKLQLGWSVSSLTLTATLAMMISGPLSNQIGRRKVLIFASVLYAISALGSAMAPSFFWLVVFRMIGGFGVGASLIIAPMYIAEIAPARLRGRMVSFNQLNIVIGISLAFFTNYMVLQLAKSDSAFALKMKFDEYDWRWMLGLETIPAVLYFLGLFLVPRSPRWLILKGRFDEAKAVMTRFTSAEEAEADMAAIRKSLEEDEHNKEKVKLSELFMPAMRLVLIIGVGVAILQQITGINSVFFYAPMIFEQSGIGTDASFVQAILVGLINLLFTVFAILFIDKLGRKPLLVFGVAGIAICMFLLSYGFHSATYTLNNADLAAMEQVDVAEKLQSIAEVTYTSDVAFKAALVEQLGESVAKEQESTLITAAISMNPTLILLGILGFVASFAISIGPVMWVLFSELFPNRIRGLAISFVGLINSAVSFIVQLVFPWELATLGSAGTFLIYGLFAFIGLFFILKLVPETKGKTLEELEKQLIKTH